MKTLIAEFKQQSFTQIIFPHAKSDWVEYLDEAEKTFIDIINNIIRYQKCLVVCYDIKSVKQRFKKDKNLFFVEYESDDTWARDCSVLSVYHKGKVELLNFTFNGWGNKFESKKDNDMSRALAKNYSKKMIDVEFVLEGGAIESNGEGIILTTASCQLNQNRNPSLSHTEINKILNDTLGTTILYLNHGYLAGDDTDSHIDTLARFIDERTIMYVKCDDEKDEHFKELKLMEKELQLIAKKYNFKLIPLPFPDPIYENSERLPATYANFLFVNNALLLPTYGVKQDKKALDIFRSTCQDRDIIPIDCSTLIKQHGSLHCVTMNFPNSVTILL
jgi:agmatine/peptidylarginine deiminase